MRLALRSPPRGGLRARGGAETYVGVPDGLDLHPVAVKSLTRGFEILEEFRRRRRPLSAHDLQRALDYPQSSTRALLVSMVTAGYLGFNYITKTYFPTPRVALLGNWIESALFIHRGIMTLMAELGVATRETVTLSTQHDLRMQFVHVIPGVEPLGATHFAGQTMSLFHSTVGAALLCTKSEDVLADLTRRFNRHHSGGGAITLASVQKRAARVGAQKYSIGYGSVSRGIGAIAMPLPSRFNEVQFVICVAGPEDRIRKNESMIVRTMREGIRRHLPMSVERVTRPSEGSRARMPGN